MKKLPILLVAAGSMFASAISAQAQTTRVIFLGRASVGGADPAIQTYLEGRFGKANVTYQDTEPSGTVTASTIRGFDVAVLSSTPNSGRYRGKLHDSSTPIVSWVRNMARNRTGEFRITDGRATETESAHAVTIRTAHAITAGFSVGSTVTIANRSAEVWWSTGNQAPGSVSLATDDDTMSNLFLTYVDVGATLLDGSKAACRRVMFGLTNSTFDAFTAEGKKLFGQAVEWAAGGCCAQTSNYGTGLAGQNGIPTLTTSAEPKFKTMINVMASNSSGTATPGLLLIGQQRSSIPFLGGTLLVNSFFQAGVAMPVGGLVLPITIPDFAVLCGVAPQSLVFQVQLLQLDSAAVQGVSMTPGMQLKTGK